MVHVIKAEPPDHPRPEEMMEALDDTSQVELNEWECEFLDSVMKQWEEKSSLTEKQLDKLVQMYRERVLREERT